MMKKCQKINLQEPQRKRNANALFSQFKKDQYCICIVPSVPTCTCNKPGGDPKLEVLSLELSYPKLQHRGNANAKQTTVTI